MERSRNETTTTHAHSVVGIGWLAVELTLTVVCESAEPIETRINPTRRIMAVDTRRE